MRVSSPSTGTIDLPTMTTPLPKSSPPVTAVRPFAGHARGSREYRRVVTALFAAGIVTFAQLYSTQAVLPLMHADAALGVSAAQAALTVSASTLGLVVAVLPWASLADHIGRVRAMMISTISATCLGLITPFMPTIELLLAVRFLEGMAVGALPALAMAYIVEEIRRSDVAIAAGTYVAGNSIGGLSGRLISGPVGDLWGWRTGLLAVALWAAAATVVFALVVPRARGFVTLHERRLRGEAKSALGLGRKLAANLTDPGMWGLFLVGFALMGGFVATYNYMGFHLIAPPFSLPTTLVSFLFVVYLAGTWAARVAGATSMRWGRGHTLATTVVMMAGGATLTLSGQLWLVFLGLLFVTMGFFGGHAVASAWIGQRASVGRAQASALYTLFYYAGSSLIGWTTGLFYESGGWTAAALSVAGLVAVVGLVVWLLIGVVCRHRPVSPAA